MKTKTVWLVILIFALTVSANYAQEITLTTTATNTVASKSTIDIPGLATNPNPDKAIIVATPIGAAATSNPHPIGAWFYSGKWNIFNTDHQSMPIGIKFNVQVFLNPTPNEFLHIVSTTNLQGKNSYIDNPALNNNPNAQVKILQNYAPDYRSPYYLNTSEATVLFDSTSGKWYIKNINGTPLMPNTAYNVVISLGATNVNTNVKVVPKNPTPILPTTPTPTEVGEKINDITPKNPTPTPTVGVVGDQLKDVSPKNPNQILPATTPQPPVGKAGGDLGGTYPNPTVQGLDGRALSNLAPKNGQVLRWNETAKVWEPSDKPSVLYFNQSKMVNMYDANVDVRKIDGLDNQTFDLPQSSRVVFHTVIEAQVFRPSLNLTPANATAVSISIEILNASNIVVARSISYGWLAPNVKQSIISVGLAALPLGKYHTNVSIIRQPGGSSLDIMSNMGNFYTPPNQGGQMIIEIFPD